LSQNEKYIVKLFEHFYNRVYRTNFKLDLSINNQAKMVQNFAKALSRYFVPDAIGVNFLIDYFASSFHYFATKNLKRKISLNWVVGPKFLKRYATRKDGVDYYTSEWLRENQINIDELRAILINDDEDVVTNYLKLDSFEELTKSRVADTEARLFNCFESTTMYNHRSSVCLTCHQKTVCKRLLLKLNPVLYNKRGYDR
jgi:hypothetical protein